MIEAGKETETKTESWGRCALKNLQPVALRRPAPSPGDLSQPQTVVGLRYGWVNHTLRLLGKDDRVLNHQVTHTSKGEKIEKCQIFYGKFFS